MKRDYGYIIKVSHATEIIRGEQENAIRSIEAK